jgi:O-antigen ligase
MRDLPEPIELRISIYPWNLKAWARAFKITGILGYALLALLLGAMIQFAEASSMGPGHTSATMLLLVRGPMCVTALLLLLFHPRFAKLHLSDTRLLFLAFGTLYLVSVLWSEIRIETLGKAVEILLATFVFLEVSRMPDPVERVDALRQIILLTISLIATITVVGYLMHAPGFVQDRPGIFTMTTAQAPFMSGNGLGYVSSALFLVIFAEWHCKRLRTANAVRQMLFAMALFSVSASRTSFVILLLSILLVVGRRSKVFALALGAVMVLMITVFETTIMVFLHGNESAAAYDTLSGRTVVWAAAIQQFETHPFLGVGGGVGGKQVISNIGNFSLGTMSSVHNGFMEVLTGLGLVGVSICVPLLLWVTLRTWQTWQSHPEYSGTYALIIHTWLASIMSTGIFGWMGYEMALFLCIMTNVDLLHHARVKVQAPAVEPAYDGAFAFVRE